MKQESQSQAPAPAASRGKAPSSRLSLLDAIQDLGLLAIIVIGAIALGLLTPVFFTRINLENLLYSSTIIAVVAIGQAFVILVCGVDLSVGAVMALASVMCVGLPISLGIPVWLAAILALGLGAMIGFI